MPTIKRIIGDYTITNKETYGANTTISTHTLYIDGNLLVGGTANAVVKTDTEITDNTITLNKGETGTGVTLGFSGIEVDRGLAVDVAVRWNEGGQYWELTNDGSTYAQIATSAGGNVIANVSADPNPQLGGNLNISTKTLYDTVANVEIQANVAGMGGTGIYTHPIAVAGPGEELITKNRALVYSIIL